jgi:hypothetical protein
VNQTENSGQKMFNEISRRKASGLNIFSFSNRQRQLMYFNRRPSPPPLPRRDELNQVGGRAN